MLMFESFYSFDQTPFSRTIPTESLYRGNDSDELIERLKYAAKRQLFAVMTGDSGTGKTVSAEAVCPSTVGIKRAVAAEGSAHL